MLFPLLDLHSPSVLAISQINFPHKAVLGAFLSHFFDCFWWIYKGEQSLLGAFPTVYLISTLSQFRQPQNDLLHRFSVPFAVGVVQISSLASFHVDSTATHKGRSKLECIDRLENHEKSKEKFLVHKVDSKFKPMVCLD
eukprot:snap_masked-scaffold_31-processed-gene-0.5-mRNA-1 protein AED:1.00 eAED:1.00 QI:0/0/0/0/1/1/2/0/138